jgi:tetratricopeptide (TPR) repeat protein
MRDGDDHSAAGRRTRAFISYSRRDAAIIDRLSACLEMRAIEPLIDRHEILVGEPWQNRLGALLAAADAVVVALSPDSVASPVCAWEVSEALKLGKRLVPVVVRAVPEPAIPDAVRRINFLSLDGDVAAAAGIIADALGTDIVWIRERTRLGELALRWRVKGGASALLLRAGELADAGTWLAATPAGEEAGEVISAWLAASRADAARRDASIAAAIRSSNDSVVSLAHRFQNQEGIPAEMIVSGLQNAEALIAGVVADPDADTDLVRTLGFILAELSATLIAQNDIAGGLAAAERAREAFDSLADRFPGDLAREADRFVGLDRLGDALAACGREADATALRERNLTLARQAAAALPGDPAWQDHLAVALEKSADGVAAAGDLARAHAALEETERIRSALVAAMPEDASRRRDHASALERLADMRLALGDQEAALAAHRASLDLTRSIAESDPRRTDWQRDLAVASQRIGDALVGGDDCASALPHYEQDLAIMLRLAGSDPGNVRWRLDALKSFDRVGRLRQRLGDARGATATFRSGLAMADELAQAAPQAADWRAIAAFTQRLSAAAIAAGDPAAAASEAEAGAARLAGEPEANPGRERRLAHALSNAAWFALLARKHDAALAFSARAFALAPTDPEVTLNRVHALALAGDHGGAEAVLRTSVSAHPDWIRSALHDLDELSRHGVSTEPLRTLYGFAGSH